MKIDAPHYVKKMQTIPIVRLLGVVFCGVNALFLLGSLFTYRITDPSWFYTSSQPTSLHNIFGSVGSHTAALFFFLFGSSSFVCAGLLLFVAVLLFKNKPFVLEWDRYCAWAGLLISCCMMGGLYRMRVFPHDFVPGGALGGVVIDLFKTYADRVVLGIAAHLLFFCALLVLFRLSFVQVAHYMVSGIRFVCNKRVALSVFQSIQKAVKGCFAFCTTAGITIKQLFDGSVLERSGKSIIEFEFDEIVEEAFQQEEQIFEEPEEEAIYDESAPIRAAEKPKKVTPASPQPTTRYTLPPLNFFKRIQKNYADMNDPEEQKRLAGVLEEKLERFGITGHVTHIKTGPVITLFEYQPSIDSKISKIVALQDDLALALQATSIRIIAPIPGRSVVGFEVANKSRSTVTLASIVHSPSFSKSTMRLPLVLGVDTIGETMIVDLASMPHLLIAGATGSGKSVCMNVILVSLLCRFSPDELKLILIDPKRLEFAPYADIGHLLFPIVTDPKSVGGVLQWVVHEMEKRYELMAQIGVRNLYDYHTFIKSNPEYDPMPYVVVMIDELSDLMMVAGKEIEERIARIAQMARAAGIHMIVATQRPSVDVITGIIKANFPSRISFKVATKIDSRTILDTPGAECLLGGGDMLSLDTASRLIRVHGAYVSDEEIEKITTHIRAVRPAVYHDLMEELPTKSEHLLDGDETLYQEVLSFVDSVDEISISLLQRKFRIGYNRSARIMDMLESEGRIMPNQGGKMRKVIH